METVTVFARGQYRLLGYDKKDRVLYASRIRQFDGALWISDVLSLEEHYVPGTPLSPPGRYQYVSLSPNAESLVLVDDDVTVVDIESRRWKRLGIDPALTQHEANPIENFPGSSGCLASGTAGGKSEKIWVLNARTGRPSTTRS